MHEGSGCDAKRRRNAVARSTRRTRGEDEHRDGPRTDGEQSRNREIGDQKIWIEQHRSPPSESRLDLQYAPNAPDAMLGRSIGPGAKGFEYGPQAARYSAREDAVMPLI